MHCEDKIMLNISNVQSAFNHNHCLYASWRSDLKRNWITITVILANRTVLLHTYSSKSGGGYAEYIDIFYKPSCMLLDILKSKRTSIGYTSEN